MQHSGGRVTTDLNEELPAERTLRDILNRMNYRLKRIQKGKPLKKTKQTDAIFANVKAVRGQARDAPETLEISMDTKAKVALGEYARGGKNPDRQRRGSGEGLGSRSARAGETDSDRHPDAGHRGADAAVRRAGDERRLGRCPADVVAAGSVGSGTHQTAGDLSGQRSEEVGPADAVLEADGGIRGLVGVGDTPGVLLAVLQQVQSDRTVLVRVGEEVEWGAPDLPEGGPAMRPEDDLEGTAPDSQTSPWRVPRRRSCSCQGDEADRGTPATFGDAAEVRHHHQTESD